MLSDHIMDSENALSQSREALLSGDQRGNYDNVTRPALFEKLKANQRTLEIQAQDNAYLETKIDAMMLNISSICKLGQNVQEIISFASSTQPQPDTSIPSRLKTIMSQLTGLLNETYDGRYLYAGATSTVKPIQQSLWQIPIGSTDYTTVNTNDKIYAIDDDTSVNVNFNPLLPGIQGLIDTINYLSNADTTNPQDPNLLQGANLIPSVLENLQSIRTGVAYVSSVFKEHEVEAQLFGAELEKNIKKEGFRSPSQLLLQLSQERVANELLINLSIQESRATREFLHMLDRT